MKYRKLGQSDLNVSVVCLGCWGIGGEFYGEVDDAESIRMIQAAPDAGINFLDTALVYGCGRSEAVIGKALAGGLRAKWIIATKCGRRALPDGAKLSKATRDWLLRDLEQSLRNLQTDYIDLYQLHVPDPQTPLAESMGAMAEMLKAGKIRAIGVSNFTVAQLEEARKYAPIVSLQPPYSMFQRDIEADLLPYCRDNKIGAIVYCPLARGLLTGKFTGKENITDAARKDWKFFKGDNFAKSVAIVNQLKEIAHQNGLTTAQLAVGWTINQPGVTAAICGGKTAEQIRETAMGSGVFLTRGRLTQIEAILKDVAEIQ